MREARGLVEIYIHADHVFQQSERLLQTCTVGRTESRVACQCYQSLDLSLARRLYLLRQAGCRQFAKDFWQCAYTALPTSKAHSSTFAGDATRVTRPGGGPGKHGSAFPVKV